ncbi:MAG: DUF2341 domain-containing protein, partial [Candidatus Shapirobacteria bacterium]|nr:DUF2341 domain-containing protein [Candidatus Shapirobacteria bacterium]
MSKFSYKSLFIIFFFLLIGVVVLSRFILPHKTVSASWWNESWSYRKAISINNSASDITNQYVKITLDTTTLISSNKMQNTCNDIRVTDINGNLLNHFIDGNTNYDCNENDTSIYVLVNSIPSSGSTIYVYYGNSSATNIEPKLGSRENPGISCKNIFEHRSDNEGNKIYFITPSGNLADILETECNMTDDSGGWTKVYDGLCTSATSTSRTTGNVLEISSPKLTFNQMRISANNWAYSDIKTTTETATMELTFSGYYQWLHSQPDTPNPDVKFYSAQDGIQDVTFTTTGVMMMGYGNNWRRILPVFYTTNHDSYMYLGATSGVGISGIEWSGSLYNTTMNNTYPAESGKGLTPRSFQEIKVWVRENEITLLTNQSMGSIQSEEIGGGPIAYWKFDEGIGSTTYDSTSNQNNGTFLSAPIWKNEDECVSGKCLAFDNVDDGVNITNNNFTSLSDYTMSAWINIQGSHKNYDGTIMSSGNWNSNHWSFAVNQSNTAFKLRRWDGTNYSTKNYSFQLNKWTYVTIVRSGSDLTYYVDGNSIGSISGTTGNLISDATNTTIGRETYAGGYFAFNGWIDEPKIYPYARTADQIKLDYNSRGSSKGSSVNLGIKSSTAPSLKSSLIAHWKFEEGNGTTTKNSGSLNSAADGILQNGPSWTNDGKFNKGLWLDGLNDYVQVPNQTSLKYTGGDMSFSVWFKPDASDDGGRIISKPWNGSGQYNYGISTGGGSNPSLTFSLVGTSSYSLGFNQTIPSDKWSHLTVTLNNNSQVKLYINGKLTNSDTHSIVSWTPSSGDSNLTFAIGTLYPYGGSWAGVTSHATKGFIDEVKVYNSTITDQEVLQDYNQGSAIQFGSTNQTIGGTTTSLEYCIPGDTSHCAPPIAEWNFEENTGTSAKDISGNNNNGTINGATWTVGKKNTGAGLNFNGSNNYIGVS